jgi:hypothetical protein
MHIYISPVAIYFSMVMRYGVIYDEIYDDTYEVIMRKFRASMEPF